MQEKEKEGNFKEWLLNQLELTDLEIENWEKESLQNTNNKKVICPNCGSTETEYNQNDDGSHCKKCGAIWSYTED
jgi:tRNA(Ile2) C34 agmatinyltransferase TiaS